MKLKVLLSTMVLALGVAPLAQAKPSAPVGCPTNQSVLGCNTAVPPVLPRASVGTPSGPLFPDVSVWQRAVGWNSVAAWQKQRHWAPSAIFKMGEYTLDHQAVRNANQTAALGFRRGGYWFARNTGCAHEAALIVWAAKYLRVQFVVIDAEVPEARGYTACLAPAVRKGTGLPVDEYTSPGSNPDSTNPGASVWTAAYGPAHTPCVWTCSVGVSNHQSILAWQFTDGKFGSVVSIPGIGTGDVSVDYGIFTTRKPPPPPPPKLWSSAEIQVQGTRPNAHGTWGIANGHWTITGPHSRIHSMPYNAKPLGG